MEEENGTLEMLGLVGVFVIKVGRINRFLICIYGGFIDVRCEA